MITANSFMKREFGKKLIEEWHAPPRPHTPDRYQRRLHPGTRHSHRDPPRPQPTTQLQRVCAPSWVSEASRAHRPTPPKGWCGPASSTRLDRPGASTPFVSVADLERRRLHSHPWSIGGGGASELKERLEESGSSVLGARVEAVGRTNVVGDDDAWLLPSPATRATAVDDRWLMPFVTGDVVRDYQIDVQLLAVHPYESIEGAVLLALPASLERHLWPRRAILENRTVFGKTFAERGVPWWSHLERYVEKLRSPLSIAFAFVATHNHFVLDRGGKVFKQSAPVIKLPAGATEEEHLDLLGVLNSSTACFWMKQVFHDKGNGGIGGGIASEEWERFFEFDGTKLQAFPLPTQLLRTTAAALDGAAQRSTRSSPSALCEREVPSTASLADSHSAWGQARREMIGLQECLDWGVYRLYGLIGDDLTAVPDPPLSLGERSFEIVLARRVAAGDEETSWFVRHGSTPITELPAHWSPEYRALVEQRIAVIESSPEIGLIERPEYKRRWNTTSWDEQQQAALKGWLLDRLEAPSYWASPTITSTARLAAFARADDDFMTAARIYAGRDDVDVAVLVADLVKGEAVPYLAALRYTDSGTRKWAQWCETWALQRREDAGDDVREIPVPPRYANADFTGVAWTHRGKLDVPKERFISYPGASSETDSSLVVGWAGWNHLERARALAGFYLGAKRDGRDASVLMPLLAGLAELVPWLRQWYDEPNADPALDRPGTQIAGLLDVELRALHLTPDQLDQWRPAPTVRGRKKKS
jgi:hypothetical protein